MITKTIGTCINLHVGCNAGYTSVPITTIVSTIGSITTSAIRTLSISLCIFTPQAPHPKMQRGKARPKSSRARSTQTVRYSTHEHYGSVPRMTVPDNLVYTFVQQGQQLLVNQTTAFTSGGISFSLAGTPQYTSLAAVFDQYRIDEVQLVFRPMFIAQPQSTTASTQYVVPTLYLVVDYDEATALGSAATFEGYSNCNTSTLETVALTFKPHIAVAAYAGTFTSYANQSSQWIDAQSPSVPHFGVKYGIDAGGSGQTLFQTWTITQRYRMSFRNVR